MEVNSATAVCFLCKEPVSADAVTVTRGLEKRCIFVCGVFLCDCASLKILASDKFQAMERKVCGLCKVYDKLQVKCVCLCLSDSEEVVHGVELEGTLDPEEVLDQESDDDW